VAAVEDEIGDLRRKLALSSTNFLATEATSSEAS
jgi:hypothetical protein